jgi:hypothetical protein
MQERCVKSLEKQSNFAQQTVSLFVSNCIDLVQRQDLGTLKDYCPGSFCICH